MKKLSSIVFLLMLMVSGLNAQNQLIIDAVEFENDDTKGITTFKGNVNIKRIKDVIKCNKMVLYTKPNTSGKSKNKQIEKMVATGNVRFTLYMKEKVYTGHGNKVIYEPQKLKYKIIGNGYLEELKDNTKIYGDTIYLDQKTGYAHIEGNEKKPVRFIMNIDEKE
ncbi:MAG: LptA/OstA family protein [Campylobacterota bacterium]|nr:LptA/OstA family protein [Campylobacterota bacterium]